MKPRFSIDLLRPGRVGRTWQEWFVGEHGQRRLMIATVACLVVLLLVLAFELLPTYWRLSDDLEAMPALRNELGAAEGDLNVLRANLRALSREAKRQVRWGDLLTTLSEETPATLKLQRVEAKRGAGTPRPGQEPPRPEPGAEGTLRIEAVTPLRSGSAPLLEMAKFMAGLMRDPALNRRFQLKSWEIKPPASVEQEGAPLLHISITLAERPQ